MGRTSRMCFDLNWPTGGEATSARWGIGWSTNLGFVPVGPSHVQQAEWLFEKVADSPIPWAIRDLPWECASPGPRGAEDELALGFIRILAHTIGRILHLRSGMVSHLCFSSACA